MKKHLFLLLLVLSLGLSSRVLAQGGPPCGSPPCGGGGGTGGKPCAQPPCVPIDQGLTLLLVAGVALGFYVVRKGLK